MAHKSKFFHYYIGFVIGFVALIIVGLCVFYSFLKNYEAAQPKSIAQNICDNYVKTGNAWGLKEDYAFSISDYETKENANKAFKSLVGKDINLNYSSRAPKGSDICFIVKSDNENLMSIALKKKDKSGSFGITGYKVSEITLLRDVYKTAVISFPSDARFTVNGKKLAESDVKRLLLPKIKDVEFDKDVVYSCVATVDNLLSDSIDIKIESKDFDVVSSGNNYSVNQKFTDEFKGDIEEFAVKGAQVYAAHMQDDLGLGALSKYFDTSSDFYKNVKNTIVNFAITHDSYEFIDVECTEFAKHSDKIYSCRVKFTPLLKLGARQYKDAFDKRIYLTVDKNDKKIIDMQSVG